MFVADHMSSNPVTVLETDLLSKAEAVAHAKCVHQLPVLDASERLVGIISDRDIRSAVGYDRTLREKLQVQEVMTSNPITVGPDTSLSSVLEQFCRHRFGALPVVHQNQLVGIITRHDLLVAMSVLLGLDRPGTSIEAALPHPAEDLAVAFDALRKFDGEFQSVIVSQMRRDGDEPSLYLRVGSADVGATERRLRQAGLILLESEKPHGTKI